MGGGVTYDRLSDSGGSSFLCGCKGVDTGVHEGWCPWNLLDELVMAGQGLYDCEAANMRAEAARAWEQAVGRVEMAKKP